MIGKNILPIIPYGKTEGEEIGSPHAYTGPHDAFERARLDSSRDPGVVLALAGLEDRPSGRKAPFRHSFDVRAQTGLDEGHGDTRSTYF